MTGYLWAFCALTLLTRACHGLVVNPSENMWVMPGDEVRLNCKTSDPIHSCSWETPYGTHYPLEKGIVADGGRLAGFDDGSEATCGVTIHGVTDKDAGDWKCHVSVVSEGEAHPGDAKVSLHLATRPDSVSVSNNLSKLLEAIKEANGGKVVSPVTCVVGKADPKPTFEWFLGSERLKNSQTQDVWNKEDGSWSQILSYEPEASHHNQTLRCKVTHVGFQKGDETEAVTRLLYDEEALNFLRKGIIEQEVATNLQSGLYPSLGVVVGITVLSLAFILFIRRRRSCMLDRNARTNNPGTPPSGNSTENVNEDPEQGQRPSLWFGCCVKNEKVKMVKEAEEAAKNGVQEEVKPPLTPSESGDDKEQRSTTKEKNEDEMDAEGQLKIPEEVAGEEVVVASEVKGRFRMFKWMKKAPQPPKSEEDKEEKAAKEEVGEKEASEDVATNEEADKEASPQPPKNTDV